MRSRASLTGSNDVLFDLLGGDAVEQLRAARRAQLAPFEPATTAPVLPTSRRAGSVRPRATRRAAPE